MTTPSSTEERDDPLPVLLAACGQEHALRWWPELTPSQRQRLHQQLAGIDLEQLQRLFRQTDPAATPDQAVRPAPVLRLARTFEDRGRDWRARAWGKPCGRSAGSIPSSDSKSPAGRNAFSSPRREHTCHADIFC